MLAAMIPAMPGPAAAADLAIGIQPRLSAAGFYPAGLALDYGGNIYVTNQGIGYVVPATVTVYAAGSGEDSSPIETISGMLPAPLGIAVDAAANLYAANLTGGSNGLGSIGVYPPGAHASILRL
ncbi:MAG: hypothetical protein ACREQI_08985 [Candidatus Binataceae bacterium]